MLMVSTSLKATGKRTYVANGDTQEYWAERDESGEYPHELHAALAKDGWIGIALPDELGGAGLGISEATMMLHTIAQYATILLYNLAFVCLPLALSHSLYRSGAGLAGAQSIHANVYATQVLYFSSFRGSVLRRRMPGL